MKNFSIIFTIAFLLSLVNVAKGQSPKTSIDLEKQRINNFLTDNIQNKTVDSTTIYSFAFQVKVKEDKFKRLKVLSITSNDSIARTLYPNYEQYFKNVNYSLFMKKTVKKTFVFPVIFLILSDKGSTCDFTIGNLTKKFLSAFYFEKGKYNTTEANTFFGPAIVTMNKIIVN